MILLLFITAGAQILISRSYSRKYPSTVNMLTLGFIIYALPALTNYLPMSLAMKKMQKKHEERTQKLQQRLAGVTEAIVEDIDIFSRDREFHFF